MRAIADLIDMCVEGDHRLDAVELEPDQIYQRVPVTLGSVTQRVACRLRYACAWQGAYDRVILLWGAARVGSTALLNVFGRAGLPAIYQPVKALLREALCEEPVRPVAGSGRTLVIKETSGPYTIAESLFDPLEAVLEAGFPPDRLSVVMIHRDPAAMLASWIRKIGPCIAPDALHAHFLLARLNELRVKRSAQRAGVRIHAYISINGSSASNAVKQLFDGLGLTDLFRSEALTGWYGRDALHGSYSSVIFPQQPAIFDLPNLHEPVPMYGAPSKSETYVGDLSSFCDTSFGRFGLSNHYTKIESALRGRTESGAQ